MSANELKGVVRNLNNQIRKIKTTSKAGLFAGALIIEGDAKKRVPVEYGNLRASAYTKKTEQGAEVGFTAAYAAAVHENVDAKWRGRPRRSKIGVYWGPKGEPRFLANSVRDQSPKVLATVKSYSEVKK